MYNYTAYTGTWKDLDDNDYRVDILQNTSCTPENVDFANSPELERMFDFDINAQGSGLFLSLISDTNMKYVNLFTGDIKEFQVIGKKNGSTFFNGWLDTENYTEPLDSLEGYDVEFTANDGIAILERMKFVDANQNHYTGVTSLWNIINICLDKSELDWQYIYVSSGLIVSGVSDNSTVFHISSGFNDNYYDEDQEPFDCRKVLEAALLNYKLIIIDNSVFIIYPELFTQEAITYKRFDYSTKEYIDDVALSNIIGDLADINFTSTNATMSIQTAYNKATLEYSPYILTDLLNYNAKDDTFSNKVGTSDNGYNWDLHTGSEHWELVSSGTTKFVHQYDANGGCAGHVVHLKGVGINTQVLKEP